MSDATAETKRALVEQLLRKQASRGEQPCPLSYGQQAMWVLYQMAPDSAAYNVAFAWRVVSPLDVEALRRAFAALVARHPALRTSYFLQDGRPVQQVQPNWELHFRVVDGTGWSDDALHTALTAEAHRPFDLEHGPLLRVTLFTRPGREPVLLLNVHHIAVDGWSLNLVSEELRALYTAELHGEKAALPPAARQYTDYVRWQQSLLEGPRGAELWNYWQEQLAGDLPVLDLPVDRPRPAVQTYNGAAHSFSLDPGLTQQLKALADAEHTTLYAVLLTAFTLLLHRYTGQDDLIVGSPTFGRTKAEFEGLVGYFVNPVAVRADLRGNPTVRACLAQIRRTAVAAMEHQDYPFPLLVERLLPGRDASRSPLIQAVFALQQTSRINLERVAEAAAGESRAPAGVLAGEGGARISLGDLVLDTYPLEQHVARFELELQMVEAGGVLSGNLQYNTDLLEPATVERMARHFRNLLAGMAADAARPVADLPLLTAEEISLAVAGPESAAAPEPVCVHALIAGRAAAQPEATAVKFGPVQLTYAELNRRAGQVASGLCAAGAVPDRPVGLFLELSVDAVAGLLGILKAGAACLPLDPAAPAAWTARELNRAGVSLVLTRRELSERLPETVHTVRIDETPGNEISAAPVAPEHLALVTDRAQIEHRQLVSRITWLQRAFALTAADVLLQHTALTQVRAIPNILWALAGGARVTLAQPHGAGDLPQLAADAGATVLPASADVLREMARMRLALPALRLVLPDGGPTHAATAAAFTERFPHVLPPLLALPESASELALNPAALPPSPVTVHLHDRYGRPVPIGVPGQVYISGPGTARGGSDGPLPTGVRARRHADGTLEVLAAGCWVDGVAVDTAAVETALLSDPAVAACAVRLREIPSGEPELVALIVPAGPFVPDRLRTYLQSRLPAAWQPTALIGVTALPYTRGGQLDEPALARLPLVDDAAARRCEEQLRALPGVREAAVVVQPLFEQEANLHLSDLLPTEHTATVQQAPAAAPGARVQNCAEPGPAEGRPAVVDGGELRFPDNVPATLPEALRRAAAASRAVDVTYVQADGSEHNQSYAELLEDAQRILGGLRHLGLQPGDRVLFQLDLNQDFIPAFWGCVLGGFVPVPLSIASSYEPSNAAAAKLTTAWSMLGSPLVLAGTALAPAIIELGKAAGLEGMQVETADALRQHAPDTNWHPCTADDVVLMPLTSGSTGMPKGVMLTHRNILSRQEGSRQLNGFSVDDVSFNWMPMDHVGGIIYFHLRDVYLGARQVHAPTAAILQEPLLWLTYIQKYRATVTWAPNFAYALIADRAAEIARSSWDLSTMRWFLNGGEACVAKTARRFLQVLMPHGLPATAMHPVFGMSETSSGITYNNTFTLESSADDDPFVDIGVPIPGDAIRVVDGAGQVVSEGVVGHLQAKGATIHMGYYKRPELNQEAFTADGWFTTGDKAMIMNGHLVITGREKDIIIINGVNYYCHEIEAVAEEVDGVDVSYTAACAVRDADSSSDQLAIFFSPLRTDDDSLLQIMKEIRSQIVRRMSINPSYLIPIPKETVPKTAIGKIQRADLRNRFHAGQYRDLLKRLDILSGSPNTLPDWFFRPVWRQREAVPAASETAGLSLILLDEDGIGEQLLQALPNAVGVRPGSEFAAVAPGMFELNPANPEHYRLLLSQLGAPVAQVLHLWTHGAPQRDVEADHERGLYSVLGLVQALAAQHRGDDPVSLFVLASHTQAVEPAERIACGRATLLGLLRTIPLELPWLKCRHVDLTEAGNETALILRELTAGGTEAEVAYRGGRRLVRELEKVRFDAAARVELPFRQGGMYLISGGLGGVGQAVAGYLLRHYGARLLLADVIPPAPGSEALRELEQAGGQVRVATVDITDAHAVREAVIAAEAAWQCRLEGIIHLAGRFHERPLTEENREGMATLLQPKVAGSIALQQVAQERPGTCFVAFSSVNGFFGGANVGAYAAANSFLDAFALQQTQRGVQTHCIAWSMWDEVGMSRDYGLKGLSRTRGYHAIGAEQGIASLLAVLHHNLRHVLVGLDGTNPYIRRYTAPEARPLSSLSAFVASDSEVGPMTGADRYGNSLSVGVTRFDRLPRTESDEVDVSKLVAHGRRGNSAERVAPRTEVERQIAGVWQKVLGSTQVSIHDSFFELGGNSLLATQLVFQLRKAVDVTLPVQVLFKTPTVAGMAQAVELARQGGDLEAAAGGFDVKLLSREVTLDPEIQPQGPADLDREPKAVFITGASGFLGSYLLCELLRQTQATVYCLVRARDPEQGRMRLRGNLAEYGLWEEHLGARIVAVPGDLGRPRFGLTPEQFATLANSVDVIYHNGALVNFTYPYAALKAPNVAGTQEVLRLAVTGHTKPVHYISTVGVFSHFRGERGTRLPEIDAPDESEGLRLGYTQSKWVAEKVVELARRRGIPVSIYRPGRLSGDTVTGACQTHDFMWMLIKGSLQLGLVPDDNVVIDMTPVDYVSRAIVALSLQPQLLGQTFHMTNPHTLYLDRLVRALRAFGYSLKQVPYSEWRSVLLQLAAEGHTENAAYPFTPLLGPEIPDEMYLEFDCRNVLDGLSGSEVTCTEVDENLLALYFRYFANTGFLEAPESRVR